MITRNCPLESFSAPDWDYLQEKIVWDPGIPEKCKTCFFNAQSDPEIEKSEQLFSTDDRGDDDAKSLFIGLQRLSVSRRCGIVDYEFEDLGDGYGQQISRTQFEFDCEVAQ